MSLNERDIEAIPVENIGVAKQVFEEHGDFIQKVIRFHMGNKPEADDLFQDLFLFLISKPLPEDVRNVHSFLYRVITARVIDRFRHETRMKAIMNRYAQKKGQMLEERQKGTARQDEKADKVFNIIQRNLPRNEAMAITLKYKHDFDINETAKHMGIKPRSVSRYLSVGMNKLRYVVKDEYEGVL